jgi:hypothetical protein
VNDLNINLNREECENHENPICINNKIIVVSWYSFYYGQQFAIIYRNELNLVFYTFKSEDDLVEFMAARSPDKVLDGLYERREMDPDSYLTLTPDTDNKEYVAQFQETFYLAGTDPKGTVTFDQIRITLGPEKFCISYRVSVVGDYLSCLFSVGDEPLQSYYINSVRGFENYYCFLKNYEFKPSGKCNPTSLIKVNDPTSKTFYRFADGNRHITDYAKLDDTVRFEISYLHPVAVLADLSFRIDCTGQIIDSFGVDSFGEKVIGTKDGDGNPTGDGANSSAPDGVVVDFCEFDNCIGLFQCTNHFRANHLIILFRAENSVNLKKLIQKLRSAANNKSELCKLGLISTINRILEKITEKGDKFFSQ